MIDMNKLRKSNEIETIYVPPMHRTILAYLCEQNHIEFTQTYAIKLRKRTELDKTRKYWAERFSTLDKKTYLYTQLSGFHTHYNPETLFDLCKQGLYDEDVLRMLHTCDFTPNN